MVTPEHRAAIAAAAKVSGKSPTEILDKVAATWELSAFDRAVLRQELAQATAPTAADRATARAASDGADKLQTLADGRAVAAFRTHAKLRTENAFAAARYRIDHAREIEHGQLLEELANPEPPEAA
ncbi:MAG TPA: hypothetical protein VIK01_29635 [Polyangiaceae bacterium]